MENLFISNKVTISNFEVRRSERRAGDPAVLVTKADRANLELNWIPQLSSIENIFQSAYKFSKK